MDKETRDYLNKCFAAVDKQFEEIEEFVGTLLDAHTRQFQNQLDARLKLLTAIDDRQSTLECLIRNDIPLLRQYMGLNDGGHCRPLCNDCLGSCPYNVQIDDVLRMRTYAVDYGDVGMAKDEYAGIKNNAAACLSCNGEPCRTACTYGLSISELCALTHRMLA